MFIIPSGQLWAEPQKSGIDGVVEFSLRNNREIKSLRDEKAIRDAIRVRAGLLPNPALELGASTGTLIGNSEENSLSIGLSQEFLLGSKREKKIAVAEAELEIFRWQVEERERLLREEVRSAYNELILYEKRLKLSENAILLSRQLLDVATERLAAGDIPELEKNLVKVEVARSEGAKIEVERGVYQTRTKLYQIMGGAEKSPVAGGDFESVSAVSKSLAELKEIAYAKRADLKLLEAEKKRGNAEILQARAEAVPNLTAGLAVTREVTLVKAGGMKEKDTAFSIGLKLSIPLPLFDKNRAAIQEAQARYERVENRLQSAREGVDLEVEAAYASYLNSEKVLSLYRDEIIPQIEENLKLTQEAYRLGEIGLLNVIQEQKKFIEVSEGNLTALYSRQAAFVKLETAVAAKLSGGEL
jgi:cobalt-zinc-cadmium efflux system outer membrane protein